MLVEQLGEGEPELAVVAGIHGDEPCGVRAVERLIDEQPPVRRPVKLVVANEEALEAGVRYLEEDMNRTFPGDPDADTHEGRLAAAVYAEVEDCLTFSIHSTRSHADPFAVYDRMTEHVRNVVPRLPVAAVVETGDSVDGRLTTAVDVIEVEAGLQGTDAAAENADRLTRAFLTATGALPGDAPAKPIPHFRLHERIPKVPAERYEVFVENFQRVAPGTTFAAADGDEQVADAEFYPVLLSTDGYEDVFGYAATRLGHLTAEA
ncbi:succinylglutamate desuccinylase/aspartoacylase family protein [Haloarchaeobius sp. HME9146]|uniref:succinylglutamate desuccinylase/aspartoacylase domain-containing protein n=1 Tax=Haloarchaeobius sp. HME9146 TaxID=2978732 RepID=UPI0021BDF41D|nr:succinylglutamate desuccinylase/aspartoacylase family protein [Haloarchaeobius sp. HME9146]MCT9097727.1 succinylglutamate desuccinylase/aspartoacylase family protein [Haloarchaeobius sp. HME9146]